MNKTFFLENEGNNFFQRNKEAFLNKEYLENDIILKNLNFKNLKNLNILEIGCSTGWRLHKLQEIYSENNYYGIDPSIEAINLGNSVNNNNAWFNGEIYDVKIYDSLDENINTLYIWFDFENSTDLEILDKSGNKNNGILFQQLTKKVKKDEIEKIKKEIEEIERVIREKNIELEILKTKIEEKKNGKK